MMKKCRVKRFQEQRSFNDYNQTKTNHVNNIGKLKSAQKNQAEKPELIQAQNEKRINFSSSNKFNKKVSTFFRINF